MNLLVKPWLYAVGVLLLTEGCFSDSTKSQTTTIFGTVIDNDTKLPVENNEIAIWGNNGVLAFKGIKLKTVFTDKDGKYSAVIDVPKNYHSLNLDNIFNIYKHRDFLLFLDGKQTNFCCPVLVGSKTQYDFIMLPK